MEDKELEKDEMVEGAEQSALDTAGELLETFEQKFTKALLTSDEECTLEGDIRANLAAAEQAGASKAIRAARLAGVLAEGAVHVYINVNPLVEYYNTVIVSEDEENE